VTPETLTAISVGDAVPESFAGEVLGAYAHACTVAVDSAPGGLVALAFGPSEAGPAGIQLSAWSNATPTGLAPAGTPVRRAGATLTIGGERIDLAGVPSCPSDVRGLSWDPRSSTVLDALDAVERERRCAEKTLPALDALSSVARLRVEALTLRLCRALAMGDGRVVRDATARLIGLGPGATPSGDDALVGVLLARTLVAEADGKGPADPLGAVLRDVVRAGAARTTAAGRSYLVLACDGRFGSTLRALAASLCAGDAGAAVREARRCLSVGHTSGADGLLGLTSTLRASLAVPRDLLTAKGT